MQEKCSQLMAGYVGIRPTPTGRKIGTAGFRMGRLVPRSKMGRPMMARSRSEWDPDGFSSPTLKELNGVPGRTLRTEDL